MAVRRYSPVNSGMLSHPGFNSFSHLNQIFEVLLSYRARTPHPHQMASSLPNEHWLSCERTTEEKLKESTAASLWLGAWLQLLLHSHALYFSIRVLGSMKSLPPGNPGLPGSWRPLQVSRLGNQFGFLPLSSFRSWMQLCYSDLLHCLALLAFF